MISFLRFFQLNRMGRIILGFWAKVTNVTLHFTPETDCIVQRMNKPVAFRTITTAKY